MEILIIWVGLGVVAALAAHGRGRSFSLWLVIGLAFGLFALIAVLVMPRMGATTPLQHAAPSPTPMRDLRPASSVDWWLEGDGGYGFDVVGESHRQPQLAEVAGAKTEDGVDVEVTAMLQHDPHNLHDSNAIKVVVGGRHVGFVPRDDAAELANILRERGMARETLLAKGRITGGWRRFRGGTVDEGSYGIRLDVTYPFALETASARRRRLAAESSDA